MKNEKDQTAIHSNYTLEDFRRLRTAVSLLTEKELLIVRLRFVEHYTIAEIVDATNLDWDEVDVIIDNALAVMRSQWLGPETKNLVREIKAPKLRKFVRM